jgi:hypothetical protein
MTPLDKAREALAAVEKATAGSWLQQTTDTEGPDFGVCIVADNLGGLVGAALPWPTEIDEGDYARVEANAAAIVSAVNFVRADLPALIDSYELRGLKIKAQGIEIAALADRVAKLEGALEPFARSGGLLVRAGDNGDFWAYRPAGGDEYAITGKDLLTARALLTPTEGAEDGR